jgi:hypothetical protein
MLDFKALKDKKITLDELIAGLTRADLHNLTAEMIDTIHELIAGCVDEDVIFEPSDPEAYDSFAEKPEDTNLAWNLGHLIVHVTASTEESAALAAEMARGVPNHGRSRWEVPWQSIKTMEQCRHRLEESRRMCHASLEMWPDTPHLEIRYKPSENSPEYNAIGRFVSGLRHSHSHLAQIAEVIRQAKVARA